VPLEEQCQIFLEYVQTDILCCLCVDVLCSPAQLLTTHWSLLMWQQWPEACQQLIWVTPSYRTHDPKNVH